MAMLDLCMVMGMEGEEECILGIVCRESSQTLWARQGLGQGFAASWLCDLRWISRLSHACCSIAEVGTIPPYWDLERE